MLIPLTRESLEQLIPLVATGNQYLYYWGETRDVLRRILISVTGVVTILVLTGFVAADLGILRFIFGWAAGLYWLWVPVYLASQRNGAYRRYPFGGIWQGQVLDIYVSEDLIAREETVNREGDLVVVENRERSLNLVVGDGSGFETVVRVPLQQEHRAIAPGQRVQLVLFSKDRDLARIARISDAYLPDRQIWVSDYPYLQRDRFIEVSERILGRSRPQRFYRSSQQFR
ncbi:MAG: phosphate ABC transporter permease [Prochlorotrichaceae cyanobacterium]